MSVVRKVAILDYGIGNVKSIANAIEKVGSTPALTADASVILSADALVLPGVGAFAHGMANLNNNNLTQVIHDFVKTGKPFMGICLGMQMLFDESEEFGITVGLGLIKGKVIKLPLAGTAREKLPHVSWNELKEPTLSSDKHKFWKTMSKPVCVYFVHSFVGVPLYTQEILALGSYGNIDFCAAVNRENIYGVQFHPEKSGEVGMEILKQFIYS
jgi:glutamine amidotransferase